MIKSHSANRDAFRTQVLRPMIRFARRAKFHAMLGGLFGLIALLVPAALLHLLIDKLLVLGVGPRLVLLLVLIVGTGRLIYLWVLKPLGLRAGPLEVAAFLEKRFPALRDRLISAVAFAQTDYSSPATGTRDTPSDAMIRLLLNDSAESFSRIPLAAHLNSRRLIRISALAVLAVGAATGVALYAPALARAYVARNLLLQDVPWPTDIQLRLAGFNNDRLRWPMGDELTLVAIAEDRVPAGVAAEIIRDDGAGVVREMSLRGDRQFVMDYGPLDGSLRLRFLIHKVGVDDATGWYQVEAIERPGVRDLRIAVQPPEYSELPAYALAAGQTSGEILRGSKVRISARTNKPIQSATLIRGEEKIAEAAITSANEISAEFVPLRGGSFHFDLLDFDKLDDTRPVTCTLQLLSDPPPKTRLSLAGAGDAVVATAILPLAVEAEDNLGIRSVDLIASVQRDAVGSSTTQPTESSVLPLPEFTARQTRYSLSREFPLMPYALKPGDQITLAVEVSDYQAPAPAMQGNVLQPETGPVVNPVGRSPSYTFRIITAEELLAELGRRESEWRREFELVIKAQEQIKKRLMDLHDEKAPQALSTEMAARYGQEERAQRQQSNRVKTVRRQFEQILAEFRVNQLDQPSIRRRLEDNVIDPMGRLLSTDMALAVELLERLRVQGDGVAADQLEAAQNRIIESMYAILAGMLKWEGYNEAISLLRDIIRMQGDVSRQTQLEMEREIERLFDDPARGPRESPTSRPGMQG